MKKLTCMLLMFVMVFTSAITVVYGEDNNSTNNVWKEFYVAESGDDSNDGSCEHPFKTI